jgi:hypothetical protein
MDAASPESKEFGNIKHRVIRFIRRTYRNKQRPTAVTELATEIWPFSIAEIWEDLLKDESVIHCFDGSLFMPKMPLTIQMMSNIEKRFVQFIYSDRMRYIITVLRRIYFNKNGLDPVHVHELYAELREPQDLSTATLTCLLRLCVKRQVGCIDCIGDGFQPTYIQHETLLQ